MPRCPHCQNKKYIIEPVGLFARAQRCPRCYAQCPYCQGEGYQLSRDEKGRDYMQPCGCQELDRRISFYNQAQIPAQFFDAVLGNFKTLNNKSLEEAFHTVNMQTKNYKKGHHRGLLLMGGVGTGKTRLLCSLAKDYIFNLGVPCLFQEFSRLLSEIKAGYDKGISESELLGQISEVEVLIIDELGKGRKTDWEVQILDQIISRRYNMQKTTHFTTNYTDQLSTSYKDAAGIKGEVKAETLKERVFQRIYSRLQEMSEFVRVEALDFRDSQGG